MLLSELLIVIVDWKIIAYEIAIYVYIYIRKWNAFATYRNGGPSTLDRAIMERTADRLSTWQVPGGQKRGGSLHAGAESGAGGDHHRPRHR